MGKGRERRGWMTCAEVGLSRCGLEGSLSRSPISTIFLAILRPLEVFVYCSAGPMPHTVRRRYSGLLSWVAKHSYN